MKDLNELQFFVHVAQAGSFTRAALRLGVPKSSVSRGIARLEARLGIPLIQRTTRRVLLTEAGRQYLYHAERALTESEQADLKASDLQLNPKGRLRIGAPTPFTSDFIAPLIPAFHQSYPELRIHLVLVGGFVVYTTPFHMDLDLLFQVGGDIQYSSLYVKLLGRIERAIYASPKYLEACGTPRTPSDLAGHACIAVGERGKDSCWRLRRGSETVEIELDPCVSVNEPRIQHQLAVDGVGIAVLADFMVSKTPKGALVRVLPGWEAEPVDVYAMYPSRLSLSANVRVFVEFVEKHIRSKLKAIGPVEPTAPRFRPRLSEKQST